MSQIQLTNQRLCNDISVTDGQTRLHGTCLNSDGKLTQLDCTIFKNDAFLGSVNYNVENGAASISLNVSDSTTFMDMLSLVTDTIHELENTVAETE